MLESWEFPLFARIAIFFFLQWIIKAYVVNISSNIPFNTFINFFVCVVVAVPFAWLTGELEWSPISLLIVGLGFVNGFAAFSSYKATHHSQTGTMFFFFWDDAIAIILTFIFLNEYLLLGYSEWLGLAICIASSLLFTFNNRQKRLRNGGHSLPLIFFVHSIIAVVIWGTVHFMMRDLGVNGAVSMGGFITPWYLGAFLASTIIFPIATVRQSDSVSEAIQSIREILRAKGFRQNTMMSVIAGVLTVVNLYFTVWTFAVAPLAVVKPIFSLGQLFVPLILGTLVFHERKHMDWINWIAAGAGIIGTGLLVTY